MTPALVVVGRNIKSATVSERKDMSKYIPTGRQTEITEEVVAVSSSLQGEGEELIQNISKFIQGMGQVVESDGPDFRRTAAEIIADHRYNGCNEAGVVFVALLRAKGKPATYIQAFQREALFNYSPEHPRLKGHVFLETEIEDQVKIVNATTGEITSQIPEDYLEAARGLDAWDIGLKEGFADLKRLFEDLNSSINCNSILLSVH